MSWFRKDKELLHHEDLVSTGEMARSHGGAQRRGERVSFTFFPGFPKTFPQKILRLLYGAKLSVSGALTNVNSFVWTFLEGTCLF